MGMNARTRSNPKAMISLYMMRRLVGGDANPGVEWEFVRVADLEQGGQPVMTVCHVPNNGLCVSTTNNWHRKSAMFADEVCTCPKPVMHTLNICDKCFPPAIYFEKDEPGLFARSAVECHLAVGDSFKVPEEACPIPQWFSQQQSVPRGRGDLLAGKEGQAVGGDERGQPLAEHFGGHVGQLAVGL